MSRGPKSRGEAHVGEAGSEDARVGLAGVGDAREARRDEAGTEAGTGGRPRRLRGRKRTSGAIGTSGSPGPPVRARSVPPASRRRRPRRRTSRRRRTARRSRSIRRRRSSTIPLRDARFTRSARRSRRRCGRSVRTRSASPRRATSTSTTSASSPKGRASRGPPEALHVAQGLRRAAGPPRTSTTPGFRRSCVPPERRKKLTNYVKIAVGFSAVLCLAGVVRVGALARGSPDDRGERRGRAGGHGVAPRAQPSVAAAAPRPSPPSPSAPARRRGRRCAADRCRRRRPRPRRPSPRSPRPRPSRRREEKEDARKSLERGKLKDASEAGQRSVALDPTDADAWLILGSAEQELGHAKSARDAFTQCTKQAKTGPVRECGLMLR